MNHPDRTGRPTNQPASVGRYRTYPAYKDSGVEWLGEIPVGWEALSIRSIGRFSKGSGGTKADERNNGIPCIRYGHLYTQHQFFIKACQSFIAPERAFHYTEIRHGDVLFAGSGETLDEIGKSAVNLLESEALCGGDILILRPSREMDPVFLGYATDSTSAACQKAQMGRGFTVMHIYASSLKNLKLSLPPLSEQRAIATFLDRETAKIDALVEKQERLIELLQEKRTALITHAVTKGLDPDAPIKDSGVEWLGEIPAGWEVKRVKFCLYAISQGWSPSCENRPAEIGEWGVLKVGCVNGTEFDPNENKALPSELEPIPSLEIHSGDVLMSRANTKELLGSTSLVKDVQPCLLLCDKLYRLEVRPEVVDREYLVFALGCHVARYQIEREATGASASMQNIAQSTIWNLVTLLPSLNEQRDIVTYTYVETKKLDALITKLRDAIDRLKEYRTALISAAVTGKIDVREEAT